MNIESLLKLRAGNTFYSVHMNTGVVEETYVRKVKNTESDGVVIYGDTARLMARGELKKGFVVWQKVHYSFIEIIPGMFGLTRSKKQALRWAKEGWDRVKHNIVRLGGFDYYKLPGYEGEWFLLPVERNNWAEKLLVANAAGYELGQV